MKGKDVLTTGEVAKICKVAHRTVCGWFDKKLLEGYRIPGSRERRIPLNQLIKFMNYHGLPIDGLMPAKKHVLIIDSDSRHEPLVDVFNSNSDLDYMISIVPNGFVAGLKLMELKPQVVLVGTKVTGVVMNEICQYIKTTIPGGFVKIIALSEDMVSNGINYKGLGFDDVLHKPLESRLLQPKIKEMMSLLEINYQYH